MEKLKVAVKNAVRAQAYEDLTVADFTNAKYLGRVTEGQVFENADGVAFVVRVIVKDVDYDAEFEVEDYAELQAKKAEDKAKAKAKAEKAKAKKAETKEKSE